ncbi:TPA: DUF3696 domain-containing protein [Yersinia enterocolitica]|nr:DUF3696 domain-containing protein [Yersinia enterocolitica]
MSNFKSFADKQELELAPITLIFGQNSSGKSTIIQSLLGMKQTLSSPHRQGEFIAIGPCVDLNSFSSIVHGHNVKNDIKLSFSFFSNLSGAGYTDIFSEAPFLAASDIRSIEFTYSHKEDGGIEDNTPSSYLKNFKYSVDTKGAKQNKLKVNISKGKLNYTNELLENYYGDSETITSLSEFISKRVDKSFRIEGAERIKSYIYKAISENTYKINKNISMPMTLAGTSFAEFSNEYLRRLSDEVIYEFNSVKYLGPLRTTPKRFYLSEVDSVFKMKGENNLGGELYMAGSKVISELNEWMKSFEIPYSLKVKNFGNELSGKVISIILKDLRNGTLVTPMDVGFGIGQVLPIITEAIVSNNNILCVEQPEIHLHPRLQAHLADLFIASVTAADGRLKNQWIIETHSESLMLRMQRRIREGKIKKELVKVYYVLSDESGSKILSLPLDDDGDFTEHWPNGFFEERLNEIFGG